MKKSVKKIMDETIPVGGVDLSNKELIIITIPVIKKVANEFIAIPRRPNAYLNFIDKLARESI